MNYRKKCPLCGGELKVDDIDYNFKGCQDEMLVCNNCQITFEFKVRYGKICRKYQYSHHKETEWHTGYLDVEK